MKFLALILTLFHLTHTPAVTFANHATIAATPTAREITAARRYTKLRRGHVSWAVKDTSGHITAYRGHTRYVSASLVKVMILVDRLREFRNRPLDAYTRAELTRMIRYSDNDAASTEFHSLPIGHLRVLAKQAGMHDFQLPEVYNWGSTHFSALDQVALFSHLQPLIPVRHRRFAFSLLASITPAQRWGLARQAKAIHAPIIFKGGWRQTNCGSLEHQAGRIKIGTTFIILAVLTDCNPSSSYGRETEFGLAKRLFRRP